MNIIKRQWTKEEDVFLKNNYKDKGKRYCAEKLNRTTGSVVNRALRKLNLALSSQEVYQRQINWRKPRGSYTVDEMQFETPNTPVVSYILGLMWADGNLYIKRNKKTDICKYKATVTVNEKDGLYLKNIFTKTGTWVVYTNFKSKSFVKEKLSPTTSFATSNYFIGKFLEEHDYHKKSTVSPSKILSLIPPHLRHYWWRGYFDGDGCFYIKEKNNNLNCTVIFTSTYEQDWSSLEQLCRDNDIKYYLTRKINNKRLRKNGESCRYSDIRINSTRKCLRFLNYIYSGEQFGLNRKFLKFNQCVEYISNKITYPNIRDRYWLTPDPVLLEIINYWNRKA